MTELSDEQRDIIRKVEKLLQVKGTTEAESSARIAKAQELLAAHNLNMGIVEREGGDGGKRAEEKLAGGFYKWEQDLWNAVANLNFCYYWRTWKWEDVVTTRDGYRTTRIRKRFYHAVVGRQVNILATQAMAGYLIQAAQRLARDRLGERFGENRANGQMLSGWAISYKEGVTDRIVEKLRDRRREVLKAEEAQARAARDLAMRGASTATGLTLAAVSQSEAEANIDFIWGEGTSAKAKARRAEEAMLRRMNEQEYTAWAQEHPEEAQRRAAAERANRRSRPRSSAPAGRQQDWGAFKAGYEAGDKVSIDLQADARKPAGLL